MLRLVWQIQITKAALCNEVRTVLLVTVIGVSVENHSILGFICNFYSLFLRSALGYFCQNIVLVLATDKVILVAWIVVFILVGNKRLSYCTFVERRLRVESSIVPIFAFFHSVIGQFAGGEITLVVKPVRGLADL